MLADPRFMRTAIVCATIAFVALLGAATSILLAGKDLYVLGFVVVTPVVSMLTVVLRRQKAQERRLDQVVAQTAQAPAQGS